MYSIAYQTQALYIFKEIIIEILTMNSFVTQWNLKTTQEQKYNTYMSIFYLLSL